MREIEEEKELGGSTITQQTAKNVFLFQIVSYVKKSFRELFYTANRNFLVKRTYYGGFTSML